MIYQSAYNIVVNLKQIKIYLNVKIHIERLANFHETSNIKSYVFIRFSIFFIVFALSFNKRNLYFNCKK